MKYEIEYLLQYHQYFVFVQYNLFFTRSSLVNYFNSSSSLGFNISQLSCSAYPIVSFHVQIYHNLLTLRININHFICGCSIFNFSIILIYIILLISRISYYFVCCFYSSIIIIFTYIIMLLHFLLRLFCLNLLIIAYNSILVTIIIYSTLYFISIFIVIYL